MLLRKAIVPRLTANAEVATVLGLIPAFSYTVESGGRQIRQC
jgi:hypothetical protein